VGKHKPPRPPKPVPAVTPTATAKAKKSFWRRLGDVVDEMAIEAVATVLTIGLIFGTQRLVDLLIGKDGKFFDFIPVAWVFDAGHIALIGRLIWRAVRRYND
jgi:hypothetical protein